MNLNKIARRTLIALAIIAAVEWLLIGVMAIVRGEGVTRWVLCTPDGEVNIRSRATTDSEVTGRVFAGDAVQVSGGKNRWAWCEGLGTEMGEGYIHQGYLVDSEVTLYPEPVTMTVAGRGRVAARRSVDGERRKWLRPGDQVTVYATGGGWACTSDGYIQSKFLEE